MIKNPLRFSWKAQFVVLLGLLIYPICYHLLSEFGENYIGIEVYGQVVDQDSFVGIPKTEVYIWWKRNSPVRRCILTSEAGHFKKSIELHYSELQNAFLNYLFFPYRDFLEIRRKQVYYKVQTQGYETVQHCVYLSSDAAAWRPDAWKSLKVDLGIIKLSRKEISKM